MSTLDTGGSGEFPDVVVACLFAVETGLNAITFGLDLGERKVDFRGDASHIETSDIADTSSSFDWEMGTNTILTVIISCGDSGSGAGDTEKQRNNGKK
jgi:hypothetical protein